MAETPFALTLPFELLAVEADELVKAGEKPKRRMLRGFASTEMRDQEGQVVKQSGLDFSWFKNNGLFRWKHTPKPEDGPDRPLDYVAKPTKVESGRKTPRGNKATYVEGEFLDQPVANEVADLAAALQKADRSMGMSVEGYIFAYKDPETKRDIARAIVRNIAFDPAPMNLEATAEVFQKAMTDAQAFYDDCDGGKGEGKGEGRREGKGKGKGPLKKGVDDFPDDDDDDDDDDPEDGTDTDEEEGSIIEGESDMEDKDELQAGASKTEGTMSFADLVTQGKALTDAQKAELIGELGGSTTSNEAVGDMRKALGVMEGSVDVLAKSVGSAPERLPGDLEGMRRDIAESNASLRELAANDEAKADVFVALTELVKAMDTRMERIEGSIATPVAAVSPELEANVATLLKAMGRPVAPRGVTGADAAAVLEHPAEGTGDVLSKSAAVATLTRSMQSARHAGDDMACNRIGESLQRIDTMQAGQRVEASAITAIVGSYANGQ